MSIATSRRSVPAAVVAALLLFTAAVTLVPGVVDARTAPEIAIDSPGDGHVVSGDLVVTGTAAHPDGIDRIVLTVKHVDTGRYWTGRSWRAKASRFSIKPDPRGATQTQWTATVPAAAMTAGTVSVHAAARTVDGGRTPRGGDTVDVRYQPGLDVNLYDTEVLAPADGATITGPITVEGTARSTDGVAAVEVVLRNTDTNRYWDGAAGQWSDDFVRTNAELSEPGATTVAWTVTVPADRSEPGSYFTRAWVRTATGHGDPFGRGRSTFTVTESVEPPAPSTSTTALRPTSTTAAPSTTAQPPTTAPTTSRPTTTTAPTTSRPPTTAPTSTRPPTTTTTRPPTTTSTTVRPPATCPNGNPAILEPCRGVLIGASGDFRDESGNYQHKEHHFSETEDLLGADFDIFHDFLQWGDLVSKPWPNARTQALADDGHILLINWKSPGGPENWARIAAGDYDADIAAAARQVADFDEPLFLTFFHEPEDNIRDTANGNTATEAKLIADYRNAFRHLHDRFDALGADNVIWVWDMQGWLGGFERYYTGGLYPGDDVVDWVAWNPYNWHACENHGTPAKWKTFTEVIAPFYDWLDEGGPNRPSTDKPLMLGEWGTEENKGAPNSTQTKAEWLDEARRVLPTRFPRLKAVVYFNTEGRRADETVQFCEWAINSSPESADAMTRLLTDSNLAARWS